MDRAWDHRGVSLLVPPRPARALSAVPVVAAHRGASGCRPEHTPGAFATAVRQGADAVEVDLVPTADGVLVARHESELSATTDVARRPVLAHLRRTRSVAGREVAGWFAEDLTVAQVRTLRARERHPRLRPASSRHDGRERVATLAEVLAVVGAEAVRRRRPVGVLLELKEPARFAAQGLDPVGPLLADLARHGLDHPGSGVRVMSFDDAVLRRLAGLTRLPLVRLLDRDAGAHELEAHRLGGHRLGGHHLDGHRLDAIAEYAAGIGVHHELVLPRTAHGTLGPATALVREAHRRGLAVQVWTLRAENLHLPREHRRGAAPGALGDHRACVGDFLRAGVDGVITDHPGLARVVGAAVGSR